MVAEVRAPSMAGAGEATEWNHPPRSDDVPSVDSPSIASELPEAPELGRSQQELAGAATPTAGQDNTPRANERPPPAALPRLGGRFKTSFAPHMPALNLNTLCVAMAAVVLAIFIWRAEIVRLLPQTATFYRLAGLEVNLRGLAFKDIKMSSETVEGKPVLVIEGMIVAQTRRPVELPRLRFSVRDAHGIEIYAWNTVLEQPVLKPGENAWFRTRLASPPEGRSIDVRFFNRQDLASGSGA
jgi:hypothetical protein